MDYPPSKTKVRQTRLIYVIDDCGMQKLFLSRTLSQTGFRVRGFTNGFNLIEALDKEHPDLIISDIDMPRIDGLELLEKVKGRQQCNHIPFWFLSSFDISKLKEKAKNLGAEKFINKPFDRERLIADVCDRLQLVNNTTGSVA